VKIFENLFELEFDNFMFVIIEFIALTLFLIVTINYYAQIKITNNVPVVCTVNGKIVYKGISARLEVKSAGMATKVRIKEGFLLLFTKAYYVSDDVKIEGIKED